MTGTIMELGILQAIHTYFQGEKIEALVFILPVGLLGLVFSIWLLTDQPTAFMRGIAIPFLVMGLVMTGVGAVVGFRTPAQVNALEKSIQADRDGVLKVEAARMDRVNKAWRFYLILWGLFGVAGLVLRFASASDFLQGLGVALVFFAGVGLLVDGFAERRAQPYAAAIGAQT